MAEDKLPKTKDEDRIRQMMWWEKAKSRMPTCLEPCSVTLFVRNPSMDLRRAMARSLDITPIVVSW